MLEPGILTIVAPIRDDDGRADDIASPDQSVLESLRDLLRDRMDLGWLPRDRRHLVPRYDDIRDGPDTGLRMGEFRFHDLHGLHCCAFVIVPAAEKRGFLCGTVRMDACLIMEATFDGPVEGFIDDLIQTNSERLIDIFRHCKGFPANAGRHPELLADFLMRKVVGHSTYFSGIPGRSITEVKTEARLRKKLSDHLEQTYRAQNMFGEVPRPHARFEALQNELRDVVREDFDLSMTEERPSDPWSIQHGASVVKAAALALFSVFLLVAWAVFSAVGFGVFDVFAQVCLTLFDGFTSQIRLFGCLLAVWLALRLARLAVWPMAKHRLKRGIWYLMEEFIRLGLMAAEIGIIALGLAIALTYAGSGYAFSTASWVTEILAWIGIAIAATFLLYLSLMIRATPARAVENGPYPTHLSRRAPARAQVWVDAMDMVRRLWCMLLWIPLIGLVDFFLLGWIFGDWVWLPKALLSAAVTLGVYTVVAGALLFVFKDAILLLASLLQRIELRGRFLPAETLADRNLGHSDTWKREEHRTHLNQNHFASMTLVKSFPRMLYLRLALWLVNFLARYLDNKGKLGGIPTIFSARWLLLDKGHRLIFLTNYVGAWDSYLGEFSDLNAYIGVNAIWTNTYVPLSEQDRGKLGARPDQRGVSFPAASLLLFRGAALEQPFKAYVRQSQLETLAWYGAYPRLSVPNMNDNSRIRRDLFRKMSTAELAAFFQRI
ncbi:MAG: hypothetical protein AAF479_02550 [Pseudomonadota bacterium]